MKDSALDSPDPLAVIWHDCECGAYAADLDLWRDLAAAAGGRVLDLGAGTGRVALDLAARGCAVTAVDRDGRLLAELARRAAAQGLEVSTALTDVRDLTLSERFDLIVAPMQIAQMLGGTAGRLAMLRSAVAHLAPGGRIAVALLADPRPEPGDGPPPLPDVVERGGWVYSSLPLEVRRAGSALEVRRLRQMVSPGGGLSEEVDATRLDIVDADRLESEADAAGLHPSGRRQIPPTGQHVGSTVVILEEA